MFANKAFLLTEHLCHYGTALAATFIGSGTTIWAFRSVRRDLVSKCDRYDLNYDRLDSKVREEGLILAELRKEYPPLTSATPADACLQKGAISGKKD